MKNLVQLIAVILVYSLSLLSCHKDSSILLPDAQHQDQTITIEDAKAAYKKLTSSSQRLSRKASNDKPPKINFLAWNKAKKLKNKKGEYIQVPLLLNSAWSLADQGSRKMVFFKKGGETIGMIVQVVGDKKYLKESNNRFNNKFTGTTTFYELDYSFLGGFSYKAGMLEGYVTESDGEIGKWYVQPSDRKGRLGGDVTCWNEGSCYTVTQTSIVTNPCGNNICGPTSTGQLQTITTRYCNTQLTCAGWDRFGFPYGDPTCLWQMDCSQNLTYSPVAEEPENTPFTDFYNNHTDWFTTEEWQWIQLEAVQDPSFIDDYRYWSEVAHDQVLNDGPLTSEDLINWAKSRGMCVGVDEVRCNRRAGKAFERAALRYLGMPANGTAYPTNVRQAQNQNYPPSVIPDGTKGLLYAGGSVNVHVQGYAFVEVKAVDGTLNLSSNEYQIKGFLDALRERRNQLQQQLGKGVH